MIGRRPIRIAALAAALVSIPLGAGLTAGAAAAPALAPVSASLAGLLSTVADALPMTVLVHGSTLAAAESAVHSAGLTELTSFRKVGIVAATGTAGQVRAARAVSGVRYLENNDQ